MKVLIIGLAKSGTSILMFRIAEGLKPCKTYFEPGGNTGQRDIAFHRKVCKRSQNAVVKIIFHAGQPDKLEQIIPLYDRVVWIVRDPRDQLISTFFYIWYFRHHPDPSQFLLSLELTRKKEVHPSSIPFHTLHPMLANKKRFETLYKPTAERIETHKGQLLVIQYEDFAEGKVEALEAYLGVTINNKVLVKGYLERVSRSKSSGSWRRWFCEEDVLFYSDVINPCLKSMGYDASDWRLEPVTSLSAREGSTYMASLFYKTPWQEFIEHGKWFVKRILSRFFPGDYL